MSMSETVNPAPIQTILVGTDLEPESAALIGTALSLARAAGAKLHVAFAFNAPLGYVSEFGSGIDPSILAGEEQRCRKELAEQVAAAGISAGELHGQTVLSGAPHRVLPELAREIGAGLLVVGATRPGGFLRRLGSTADRVLRRATCPVLVVRGDLRVPPCKALAPVDLSPLAAESFRTGLGLLQQVCGGQGLDVKALFVLSTLQRQVAPQFTPEQVDRFSSEELGRFVDQHAGTLAGSVQRKVLAGGTREEILGEVKSFGPDVVVLGTHGLGGFDRLVIGSVAADIIREAPCSVLVVPPDEMRD